MLVKRNRLSRRSRQLNWGTIPAVIETLEDRSLLSASPLPAQPDLVIDPTQFQDDSILVRYRDGVPMAGTASGVVPGLQVVHLGQGVTVADALWTYRSDPNVVYAEPNYRVSLQYTPDDAQFDQLWGMNNTGQTGGTFDADIDALEAWDYTTGNGNIVVAVIDTGVDYTHEDLAANIWVNPGEIAGDGIDNDQNGFVDDIHGYNFAYNNGNPMDDHDHGTHVAGTIGAVGDNAIGVAGVNWNVQIMAVKFLDSSGGGSISNAIQAIHYAVQNGAHISNNSWGLNGSYSQAMQDAIAAARDAGHIFVAAAGNGNAAGVGLNNDATPFWPANHDLDNVVAVAALNHNDQKATFSNFGATSVDVGAPGVGILSTTIGDTYSSFSGTSMATPHVAGLLSLIWDQNPEWSWQQVLDRFYETLEPVDALQGITVTGSRINAGNAVGPDVTGPQIRSTDPAGFIFEPISSLRVQASEALDPASFGPANILSFMGPNGAVPVTDVVPVPGENNRLFDILFPLQEEMGPYRLTIGGAITDMAGNLLDQDRDGLGAELGDDTFDAAFDLVPFFSKLDFGTEISPVSAGFQRVDPTMGYSAERGFGWTLGGIDSRDRGTGTGDSLERDFNFATGQAEFAVDVPTEPALYTITITMGDGSSGTGPRDEIGIFIEGQQLATVTTNPGEYVVSTFQVTVSDGQFNLRLEDLGGSDSLVLINGLDVEAVGPDLVGPRVVQSIPSAETSSYLDRFLFTFDEPVDASTFTVADVLSLTGPLGAITPTEVNEVAPTIFEVLFDPQTELGEYAITIGPDIADLAGNGMDQDLDRLNGETPDDQFSTSTELVPIQPIDVSFDFGTASSPVQSGMTQVVPTTYYDSSLGYGWVNGSVSARDRGPSTGTPATQDFNYTGLATFAVDVPSDAVYVVTLTMGDGLGYVRDDMGIYLEGKLVDSVTANGIAYEVRTYQVRVTDGQLTIKLDDLGGDPLTVINALHVVTAPPDNIGPQLLGMETTEALGTLDEIVLNFNETIDVTTFTPNDVVSLTDPNGVEIPVLSVEQITGTQFAIQFAPQTTFGEYHLVVGPEIRDLVGNRMDQDQDGIDAEVPDDQFSGTLTLSPQPPFEAHFDFGTSSSPVAAGATPVLDNSNYNAAAGFGWTSGSVDSRDRGGAYGNDATRDFNFTGYATFAIDVPAVSSYQVTFTMGDGYGYVRDQMGIFMEGTFVDSVTTDGVNYSIVTYAVTVTDGQLNILFDDLGGDPSLMINAIDILELGPDVTGPKVVSMDPSEATEVLDRLVVTFNETIDPATFTVEDVVELLGPNGAIQPTAVHVLSGGQFEILFAPQTALGTYTLTLGPDIFDVAGNAMDQDEDGIAGEVLEDRFQANAEVIPRPPFEAYFDFGTSSSPVQTGYTQVTKTTYYSAATGFGWLSGNVVDRDRGAWTGNALKRDFNYTAYATFVVDLPAAGDYEVTITLGDGLGYVRDNMGIYIEGDFIDSVTSNGNYETRTYMVTITDGQLTLLLDDLGGDPWVMINGLEIHEVVMASGAQASVSTPSTGSPTTGGSSTVVEPLGNPTTVGIFSPNFYGLQTALSRLNSVVFPVVQTSEPHVPAFKPLKKNGPAGENQPESHPPRESLETLFSTRWPELVHELEQLGSGIL